MIRSAPLAAVLCLEAALLFAAPDLLPVWTDELFTLTAVAHPVREIIPLVQRDIHPPLYFILLRGWSILWASWSGIAKLRVFSGLWALVATALLDIFWARRFKPAERWLALAFFGLSPCLILYGRMARSYSMQTALALLALAMLERWIKEPSSWLRGAVAAASLGALLYTHYVPGLALLAGFLAAGSRKVGWRRAAVFASAIGIGYLPWAATMFKAVGRWGTSSHFSANYALSGNALLEQFVKIGFGLVSLTIGETFLAVSLVLAPVMLLLAFEGARRAEFLGRSPAIIGIAAVIGYIGVARWSSYPFIPARLLWLLPFLSLAVALGVGSLAQSRLRWAAALGILISFASSMVMYFRRENFLNPGYAAPLAEIASSLNRSAKPGDLILMDPYNTDYQAIAALLAGRTPSIVLEAANLEDARKRLAAASTVWIVRNTRDISPGHTTTEIEREACAGREERDLLLEPYSEWQQEVMKLAGFRPVLTHFYQLTECTYTPGRPSSQTERSGPR